MHGNTVHIATPHSSPTRPKTTATLQQVVLYCIGLRHDVVIEQ